MKIITGIVIMYKLMLIILLGGISFSSIADTHCIGKVEGLGMGKGGILYVSGPGGLPATYLCSVHSKSNNVETEACKVIYSQLLAAKAQNETVNITFNPATPCTSAKSWGWAANFNWVIVGG